MQTFYTYLHCKPDGTPFYVGKGSGNRAKGIRHQRNRFHKSTVEKYGEENILAYVFECDSEQQAFDDEKHQIDQLRREGYVLANFAHGGRGGLKGTKLSEETKLKMAIGKIGNEFGLGNKSRTGQKQSEQERAKKSIALMGNTNMVGKTPSAESNAKRSATQTGIPKSAATRAKMSESATKLWARRKLPN